MNKCIFTGRLTKDPDVRYSQGANGTTAIATWTLAVNRKIKAEGQPTADFLNFKAFGKLAENIEKYWCKGMKMDIVSHVQSGSYTDKDGKTCYYTEFVADEFEFGESKSASSKSNDVELPVPDNSCKPVSANEIPTFMNIPEGIDEDLPFARPSR